MTPLPGQHGSHLQATARRAIVRRDQDGHSAAAVIFIPCVAALLILIIGLYLRNEFLSSVTRLWCRLRNQPEPERATRQPQASLSLANLDLTSTFSYKGNGSIAGHDQPVRKCRVDYGSAECVICAENFTFGIAIRELQCGHQFHKECVDPWLLGHSSTCPLW